MKKKIILLTLLLLNGTSLIQNKIQANIISPLSADPRFVQTGLASWYSEKSPGINEHTANNEIFDDSGMTAAMWGVPFNQMVRITNLENGQSIIVRVNDRGPHQRYLQEGRVIDLSKHAFSNIASLHKGLIRVQLELL
jgi:rare lipoprotein A